MKTLKIKRLYAYAILRKLKEIPPRLYPSTDEIKQTVDAIIPALKSVTEEYQKWLEEAETIHKQIRRKKIKEEEGKKKLDAIRTKWDNWSDEHGEEIVEVKLENDAFKTLTDQFEREDKQTPVWGNAWLENLEEFAELSKAFDEAS